MSPSRTSLGLKHQWNYKRSHRLLVLLCALARWPASQPSNRSSEEMGERVLPGHLSPSSFDDHVENVVQGHVVSDVVT